MASCRRGFVLLKAALFVVLCLTFVRPVTASKSSDFLTLTVDVSELTLQDVLILLLGASR